MKLFSFYSKIAISALVTVLTATAATPGTDISPVLAQAITREVLRPNGDPEGYPLPLAARWTGHNILNVNTGSPNGGNFVSYPFPLNRVLDDIAAGHKVMPFFGWPHANAGPNQYFEPAEPFQKSFRRLAAAKLPFEIEAGNVEEHMFKRSLEYAPAGGWPIPEYLHQKPIDHPAYIDNTFRLTLTAAAAKSTKTLSVKGFAPSATLPTGSWLLLAEAGRTIALAAAVTADSNGTATLEITEALPSAVAVGETLMRLEKKMDFWSQAKPEVWKAGGAMIPITGDIPNASSLFSHEDWKKLADIYPDPPQIQICSNNEGARGHVGDAPNSWHAQNQKSDDLRTAFGRGYAKIWPNYMQGMREAFPWKPEIIKAIGYNAFGVNFEVGRWSGWRENAIPLEQVDIYAWLAWDGSATDYYSYDWSYPTDEHVGSPHIGAMQAYTMLSQRAIAQVPGYLWQMALYDGGLSKRYRYITEGHVAGIPIGLVATAPEIGSTKLLLRGGKPGMTILEMGDVISIDGHSIAQPTTCRADFEKLTLQNSAGKAQPAGVLTMIDVGETPAPGNLLERGDKIRLTGSGKPLISLADSMAFAHCDFSQMRGVSLRLLAFGDGKTAVAKGASPAAVVPDSAAHVDREAMARQHALEQITTEDKAGLMIRGGTLPNAAFLAILRSRSGALKLYSRSRDGGPVSELATAETAPGPLTIRFTSAEGKSQFRPSWSADGVTWKPLGDEAKEYAIESAKEALLAGPMVSTWTASEDFLSYTVAAPAVVDRSGNAVIEIADNDRSNPLGGVAGHPEIVAGAKIQLLDYQSRYEGFSTVALWMTRPRIIREFGWGDFDRQLENQWKALMRATDRVWNDPVLTKFWRKGKLVANPAYAEQTQRRHPMSDLGEFWDKHWAGLDCFFQLDVPINPPFSEWPADAGVAATSTNEPGAVIKVWAIAYELGAAPNREWMLLVQSPRQDREAVAVTIPGFGETIVNVTRNGAFYHLKEGGKEALRISGR